jgi:hypothetical protein
MTVIVLPGWCVYYFVFETHLRMVSKHVEEFKNLCIVYNPIVYLCWLVWLDTLQFLRACRTEEFVPVLGTQGLYQKSLTIMNFMFLNLIFSK